MRDVLLAIAGHAIVRGVVAVLVIAAGVTMLVRYSDRAVADPAFAACIGMADERFTQEQRDRICRKAVALYRDEEWMSREVALQAEYKACVPNHGKLACSLRSPDNPMPSEIADLD